MLLAAAPTEKIVYDETSRPIYDTKSDPVYEVTKKVTGYKYTGWQTIDGATYYFDKNGNKVTGSDVYKRQVSHGPEYNPEYSHALWCLPCVPPV